jgi:hypothetical protein
LVEVELSVRQLFPLPLSVGGGVVSSTFRWGGIRRLLSPSSFVEGGRGTERGGVASGDPLESFRWLKGRCERDLVFVGRGLRTRPRSQASLDNPALEIFPSFLGGVGLEPNLTPFTVSPPDWVEFPPGLGDLARFPVFPWSFLPPLSPGGGGGPFGFGTPTGRGGNRQDA